MARSDFRFSYPKRVRYVEIDSQMVVFFGRYLEYSDIGVTEYLRAVGMFDPAHDGQAIEFHVAKALVNYRASIRYDEIIDLCVRCSRVGRSSMTLSFEFHGSGQDDLRASGELVNVHVGNLGAPPSPIPRHIIDLLESYEGRTLQEESQP
jgi:acyl-CoA thioester hydrolase